MSRREFIASAAAATLTLPTVALAAEPKLLFQQRGYYLCFMRMPTFGLAVWKEILDGAAADRANTVILWMGGAFRSKKFPITWQWAKEHENVKADFGRELISNAHRHGIKVLLGFTPFGYDGVNQVPLEQAELKAVGQDGKPVAEFGIGCWGWNLSPAKADSRRFMREYVREMAFEFYPEADGLFIESSDYAICHCAECGPKYFDHEFAFVRDNSNEVWAHQPYATVVVYPHYFSGVKLRFAFAEATAAKQPLDPRWTLFFTPHSAALEPSLIAKARGAWWWNEAPSRFDVANIRAGVQKARDAKCSGYVPSLECYSYVVPKTEFGEPWLVGKRQIPFGFGWLKDGENPYRERREQRLSRPDFPSPVSLRGPKSSRRIPPRLVVGRTSVLPVRGASGSTRFANAASVPRRKHQTGGLVNRQTGGQHHVRSAPPSAERFRWLVHSWRRASMGSNRAALRAG